MKKQLMIVVFISFVFFLNAQEISSDFKNELRSYFEITKSKDKYIQLLDQIVVTYKNKLNIVPDKFWDDMRNEFIFNIDKLFEDLIPIYYKYYSVDDIRKLNEFYKTELGQKLIAVSPYVIKDSYDIGVKFGEEVSEKMLSKLKEKGYIDI